MEGNEDLLDESSMEKTLKEVVGKRLAQLQRNPFEAARVGELEKSFVNDLLIDRKVSVSSGKIRPLARALDWTADDLLRALEGIEPGSKQSFSSNTVDRDEVRQAFVVLFSQFLDAKETSELVEAVLEKIGSRQVDGVAPETAVRVRVSDAIAKYDLARRLSPRQ